MRLLIFIIKRLETFKNMIKVHKVSIRYIVLFTHNYKVAQKVSHYQDS